MLGSAHITKIFLLVKMVYIHDMFQSKKTILIHYIILIHHRMLTYRIFDTSQVKGINNSPRCSSTRSPFCYFISLRFKSVGLAQSVYSMTTEWKTGI
jgi:hypothetical protein